MDTLQTGCFAWTDKVYAESCNAEGRGKHTSVNVQDRLNLQSRREALECMIGDISTELLALLLVKVFAKSACHWSG